MEDVLPEGAKRERKQLYYKDYDSSGDDEEKRPVAKSTTVKKVRSKECPGCGATVSVSTKTCPSCDYGFTSKSMLLLNSTQTAADESKAIRDKFPFEPEREEDGSLIIQSILGRRPRKSGHRWLRPSRLSGVPLSDLTATDAKFEYEYLIKYKSLSYLHVQWLTANDIEAMSLKSKQTLLRYLNKLDRGDPSAPEDAEIDPSYLEVERILDFREEEVNEVVDELPPPPGDVQSSAVSSDGNDGVDTVTTKSQPLSMNAVQSATSLSTMGSTNGALQAAQCTETIPVDASQAVDNGEEVKSVHKIFQPAERCRKVLEKIWDDPASIAFQEPVDINVYDDYLDVVETPMCLRDVLNKLNAGEYSKFQQYTKFRQDVRLIWQNCKAYNLYKSQIWHTAHTFSLMFERLFQAWVLSFSDGSIRFDEPLGQPWQPTCRKCLNDENEEKVMLCDHCDASFHIYCLKPPLAKVPEEAWLCARCTAWFTKTNARVLSAAVEDEARAIAETAGIRKVVKIRKKKYLVKWRGLSYRDCTWETSKDINDDQKVSEYHQLNDSPPEDPPLTQAEIGIELAKDRCIRLPSFSLRPSSTQDLDANILAQIRALHFIRFGKIPPDALMKECGPGSLAFTLGRRTDLLLPKSTACEIKAKTQVNKLTSGILETISDAQKPTTSVNSTSSKALVWVDPIIYDLPVNPDADRATSFNDAYVEKESTRDPVRAEVADVLSAVVYCVGRNCLPTPYPARPRIPFPNNIRGGEIEVCVRKGIKPLGLKLCETQTKQIVIMDYKPPENGQKSPVDLTARTRKGDVLIAINNISLVGLGLSTVQKLLNSCNSPFIFLRFYRNVAATYFQKTRAAPLVKYNALYDYLNNKPEYESFRPPLLRSLYFGVHPSPQSTSTSIKWDAVIYSGNKSEVLGTFSDEEEAAHIYNKRRLELDGPNACNLNFDAYGNLTADARALQKTVTEERAVIDEKLQETPRFLSNTDEVSSVDDNNKELDGKSCQEDDIDSFDSRDTDSAKVESESDEPDVGDDDNSIDSDSDDENARHDKWEAQEDIEWRPVKDSLRPGDGPVSRLLRAVIESDHPPIRVEWVRHVIELGYPQSRRLEYLDQRDPRVVRKIDQLDMASGAVIKTWDGVNSASRNLNITSQNITRALLGQVELAGGFRWRLTPLQPILASIMEESNEEDGLDAAESSAKKAEEWKSKLHKKSKTYRSGGTLRDYQLDGLNWLLRCWYSKRSSILADEMGLGKTVQVVTFLDHLFDVEALKGPFLVAVPLSTIEHWKREFEGWSRMTVCLYHDTNGGRDMRDVIREYEWYYTGRTRRLLKFQVLITTYDDLIRDYEELAEVPWRVVVVDEAHRMKNTTSKLLECMRSVVAKGLSAYGYQHRILMTGTPLQNNTAELWSLLNFIEPAKFPDAEKFAAQYGKIETQQQVENLQRRIAPHLLRRVKEDVARDIPPKEETIIDVELTTMQKQYYRAIFEHNHGFLMQTLKAGSMPHLMNIQMELRKCCNHPFLIQGIEQTEMETLERSMLMDSPASRIDRKTFEQKRMENVMIPTSGKMVLLDKLLPKLQKEGHKVLIFSQMVRMIDLIEEFCEFRGYSCERLDGRVGGNDRQTAIDRFNKSANSFVFLLSTRAGGVGINLTAADTVIIFDSDWNPQNDVQAMARCHRIGQSKSVTIYRLITRRSFEAEMFERASRKLGLEQAVLGTRQFNDQELEDQNKGGERMDAKEMEQLLREGAYAVLLDDDEDVKEFFAQDIDKILEQRSHVLVTEGGQPTESWLNKKKKSNRTRKSLFTGEGAMEHAEIDVNDPDFWKKVLPDLVTPDIMLERLSDDALNEDDEDYRELAEKFMKDLSQMMTGMLDLDRRKQLPDRERAVCQKLLLRVTLKEDVFDDNEIALAQQWLTAMEGVRRRARVDVLDKQSPTQISPSITTVKGKGKGKVKGKAKASGKGSIRPSSSLYDIEEDIDPDLGEDDEFTGAPVSKGSKRKLDKSSKASRKSNRGDGDEYDGDEYDDAPDQPVKKLRKSKSKTVYDGGDNDDDLLYDTGGERNSTKKKKKFTISLKLNNGGVSDDGDDDIDGVIKSKKPRAITKNKSASSKSNRSSTAPMVGIEIDGNDSEFNRFGDDEYPDDLDEDGMNVTVSSRGRVRKSMNLGTPPPAALKIAKERAEREAGIKKVVVKQSSKKKKLATSKREESLDGGFAEVVLDVDHDDEEDTRSKVATLRQQFLQGAASRMKQVEQEYDEEYNDENDGLVGDEDFVHSYDL